MAETSVTIEKMCYGGSGFGRVEGRACFVPFTAPGDLATIRIVKDKRSFVEGELLHLDTPSPLRVQPPCPAFGSCGGCNWQHLPYEEQLAQKGAIYAESLRRIGKVESELVLPVLGSPSSYGYRSRIQLKVGRRNGATLFGFYRNGSHQIVEVPEGCAIADPLLNRMAAEFRPLLARLPEPEAISQIDLSIGDQSQGIAVVHFSGKKVQKLSERLRECRGELPSVSGLFIRNGKADPALVFGIEALTYTIPAGLITGSRELKLRFSRGGFSQVNYVQNLELIRTVCEWAELSGTERVLDLYCGNGNISLPLAQQAAEVVGVEGFAPSIEDAVANAAANGVENVSFHVSDASLAVRRFGKGGERFDLVVLDPPRGGAEAAGAIAELAPEKIIYISCDPATLARDLALLCGQGYRVTRSQPVDMFPQTYHLESVTELKRC